MSASDLSGNFLYHELKTRLKQNRVALKQISWNHNEKLLGLQFIIFSHLILTGTDL